MLNFLKKLFEKKYEDISVAMLPKLQKQYKNLVILDVRTSKEYKDGKIPKAINIDVMSSSFSRDIKKLDPNKPYLVYCRSGMRSARAANAMGKAGFTNVYNLKGGYMAWK